jgi:hypothetical protein
VVVVRTVVVVVLVWAVVVVDRLVLVARVVLALLVGPSLVAVEAPHPARMSSATATGEYRVPRIATSRLADRSDREVALAPPDGSVSAFIGAAASILWTEGQRRVECHTFSYRACLRTVTFLRRQKKGVTGKRDSGGWAAIRERVTLRGRWPVRQVVGGASALALRIFHCLSTSFSTIGNQMASTSSGLNRSSAPSP